MKVFITGGANGIGRATVEKLLDKGHEVVVFDIDGESLSTLPEEVTWYQGDVYDKARVKQVVEKEKFDVLVNSAAFYELGAIEDMGPEKVEAHFDANVFGTLNVTRAALPMLRERSGKIVNMSSLAGKISAPFFGIYSATKHSIEAISDSLRLELEPFDVDVVVIEPGPVETGFNERARRALEQYLSDTVYEERYREKLEGGGMEGIEPEKAAEKVVRAIETADPKARYTPTVKTSLTVKLAKMLPTSFRDYLVKKF
ncbi:MAG: SDR family NAD(P)-dependent oxidoreductase [Candidatus Nanohaloarchaea archaeon]